MTLIAILALVVIGWGTSVAQAYTLLTTYGSTSTCGYRTQGGFVVWWVVMGYNCSYDQVFR